MELVVGNLSGKVRREKLGGRDYLVAPLTMIVPGVLNGSDGPLYYPADELKRNPSVWNNVPMVLDHPKDSAGNYVSARSPGVLDKVGLGYVFEVTYNDKLVAEGWFDLERTRTVKPEIITALEAGQPIGLSTGLGTDKEKTPGTFNGTNYSAIAKNYVPDHLAILTDKIGACSITQGCGVLVNERGVFERLVNWIINGKRDPNDRETNQKVEDDPVAKLSDTDKKTIVDNLIANCDCSGPKIYTEADRAYLNNLGDDRLTSLDESRKRIAANEKIIANIKKPIPVDGGTLVFNESSGQFDKKVDDGLVDNLDAVPAGAKIEVVMVGNVRKFRIIEGKKAGDSAGVGQAAAPAKMTDAQFLESLPPSFRTAIANVVALDATQKAALISRITANENNPYKKEELEAMELPMLVNLARLAGAPTQQPTNMNFFGAGGAPPVLNAEEANDVLPLPTMNFEATK